MHIYNKTGFFAVGVEGISKPHNVGAILRTAHAFHADFVFTVNPKIHMQTGIEGGGANAHRKGRKRSFYDTDTSKTFKQVPYYEYDRPSQVMVPKNCAIVGVELTDDAVALPEFCHPNRAAYVFGPERGNLSDDMQHRCDYMIKIPSKFCLNVSIACAIVIYDRVQSLHKWRRRPLTPRGIPESPTPHQSGGPIIRKNHKNRLGYDI